MAMLPRVKLMIIIIAPVVSTGGDASLSLPLRLGLYMNLFDSCLMHLRIHLERTLLIVFVFFLFCLCEHHEQNTKQWNKILISIELASSKES